MVVVQTPKRGRASAPPSGCPLETSLDTVGSVVSFVVFFYIGGGGLAGTSQDRISVSCTACPPAIGASVCEQHIFNAKETGGRANGYRWLRLYILK